jgi:PASTA domain
MATRARRAGPNAPTELISPPPPAEPPEPRPEHELWSWLLVIVLLVLAGLAAAWYATRDSGGASSAARTRVTTVAAAPAQPRPRNERTTPAVEQVTVPDLVGQRRDEALRTLDAQGLQASVDEVPSDQEKGLVVAQDPAGGTKVDKGSSVALNVSTGPSKPAPAMVTVPDVVGQPKGNASDAIRAAGLDPSTQHVPSTQPEDTVVSQSPAGGASTQQGSQVLLNVSAGPPKAKGKDKSNRRQKSQQPETGG